MLSGSKLERHRIFAKLNFFYQNMTFLIPAALLSASALLWALETSAFQGRLDNAQLLAAPFATFHRHRARQMKIIILLSSSAHLEAELNHPPTPQPLSAGDFLPLLSSSPLNGVNGDDKRIPHYWGSQHPIKPFLCASLLLLLFPQGPISEFNLQHEYQISHDSGTQLSFAR